jgi:hypothetical protein
MPSFMEEMWDICMDMAVRGQKEVKEESTRLLALMIYYQYSKV